MWMPPSRRHLCPPVDDPALGGERDRVPGGSPPVPGQWTCARPAERSTGTHRGDPMNGTNRISGRQTGHRWAGALGAAVMFGLVVTEGGRGTGPPVPRL